MPRFTKFSPYIHVFQLGPVTPSSSPKGVNTLPISPSLICLPHYFVMSTNYEAPQ